jgi:hypothetical protein
MFDDVQIAEIGYYFDRNRLVRVGLTLLGQAAFHRMYESLSGMYGTPTASGEASHSATWTWSPVKIGIILEKNERGARTIYLSDIDAK